MRAGRAANNVLSRCPESHAYVVISESSGLIFMVHHRVRRRRRRKGRGTTCRRESHGEVTARRTNRGTMRWGSHGYKIGINESTACPARFSISIMNFDSSPTRDGRGKRNAGGLRSACAGARSGRVDALRAASAGESMVYRESGYIVKVTVETNSARMSEV